MIKKLPISLLVLILGVAIFTINANTKNPGQILPWSHNLLTLESIFGNKKTTHPKKQTITLVSTGDVLTARTVNFKAVEQNNFKWAFANTADFLSSADIALINLENPLVENCPPTNSGMIFCGDPQNVEGLIFSGIDIVNLANNHTTNYGKAGLANTTDILESYNILYTNINKPAFKETKRTKFAFLGYNEAQNTKRISDNLKDKISIDIKSAKNKADIVIVSFHWGVEYKTQPIQRQKDLAHLSIDSGADIVIGHHPHWIQPIEIYKNKPIIYSHGNFIFDQMWSEKTRVGLVTKFTFYQKELINIELFPTLIENYGKPKFLTGEKRSEILNELLKESRTLSSTYHH